MKPLPRSIGYMTLALMTVAAMFSLSGLTSNAEYGFSSVFFYAVGAILFFIPTALIAAFLATGWSTGGVYIWVSEAFGEKFGFLAIWLQWIQSLALYMTILSFAAATVAFVVDPALANNQYFILGSILVIFWGSTLLNFLGMKLSSRISSMGALFGTLLPGAFLIALSLLFIFQGNHSETSLSLDALIPDITDINNIALALGGIVLFAGIEMTAAHIREVKNPAVNYPKAIFTAAFIALICFVLGSLAIAIVVPQDKISLVSGVMEAFSALFDTYNVPWLLPIVMLFIIGGVLAQVNTWIAGPSKGILNAARHGCLPPFMQKTNEHGTPTIILILQGIIVTIFGLVFVFVPDVSASFWILMALTAQLYMIMYVLMFASAIKLKYSQPDVKPSFRIPFGKTGIWFVAGIGLITSIVIIAVGFIPPSQEQANPTFYEVFLVSGIIIVVAIPIAINHLRKKSWIVKPKTALKLKRDAK